MSAVSNVFQSPNSKIHQCAQCQKNVERIMKCSGCFSIIFCGRECQVINWKGGHKTDCSRLKAEYNAKLKQRIGNHTEDAKKIATLAVVKHAIDTIENKEGDGVTKEDNESEANELVKQVQTTVEKIQKDLKKILRL